MKRFYNSLIMVALSVMFFASCEALPGIYDPNASLTPQITFSSSINSRATNTKFENGDAISATSIFEDQVQDTDVNYTFNGSIFEAAEDPIKKVDGIAYSYRAVYPTLATTNEVALFSVKSDQSAESNYTLSDLMTSVVSATIEKQPKLVFDHHMAKVALNITSDVELTKVSLIAKGEVAYNTLNNTVSTTATKASEIVMKPIIASGSYTNSYEALVAPQPASAVEFVITTSGTQHTLTFESAGDMTSSTIFTLAIEVENGEANIVETDSEDKEEEETNPNAITLASLSASNYPTDDTWIISDKSATTEDFAGLHDAIEALSESGRKISLEFPNLVAIPDFAIYGEASYSQILAADALVSVSAKVATRVGTNAFSYCYSLTNVELPNVIEVDAFGLYYNSALTKLSLPKAEVIGSCAIGNCDSLTSFDVAKSVTSIGGGAFNGCDQLERLNVYSAEYICEDGVVYSADKQIIVSALQATSPANLESNSVKRVEDFALRFCDNLVSVSLPNATSVNRYSIANNHSLKSVSLASLEVLGEAAFWLCSSLIEVSLPSITELRGGALGACGSLSTVKLASNKSAKIKSIDPTAFTQSKTSNIDLEISSTNSEYINTNDITLNVGEFYATFNSFTIDGKRYSKEIFAIDITQLAQSATKEDQSITIDGISYVYNNTYYNTNYGSIASYTGGYIYNTTALNGLRKIVITEDYSYFNYSLFVGSTQNSLSEVSYTKQGNTYTFEIPDGCHYFSINNNSNYNASADKIELYFDSIADTRN